MSDVLCGVDRCGKPVADHSYICPSCAFLLDDALGEVIGAPGLPGLAAELEVTLSRQDRIDNPGGVSSPPPTDHTPRSEVVATLHVTKLPYNGRASEAGWVLRNTLSGWARLIAQDTGADDLPVDVLADMARWLRPRVGWLRHHEAGPEAVAEITEAVRGARRAIDRPPSLWYCGPCDAAVSAATCGCTCHIGGAYRPACDVPGGCGTAHQATTCTAELYAHPGALNVICRECGSVYDLAARREWLLGQVEDQLMHSVPLAALVRHLGVQVADSTIRGYAAKGRIVAHTSDVRNRPLYRIGDVLEIVLGPRQVKKPA